MSLWLALLWGVACVAGFIVYVLYRKRSADIGRNVGEEIDHRVRRILKAAREAEDQLRDSFLGFQSPSVAVQDFQKVRGEIEGVPRASPTWRWSDADLELLRRQSVADETAHRCRPWAVASIVGVLTLTVGTAVATVILSNSVQPVLATPANAASVAGGSLPPALPAPVNWSPPAPTPVNLPTLPTASAPPPDITSNPPVASTQNNNNVVTQTQGGAPTNPTSNQAGAMQAGSPSTTNPSGTSCSTSPPVNSPPVPPAPSAPAVSAGNAPAALGQDNSNGMTSAQAVTTNPGQPGVDP